MPNEKENNPVAKLEEAVRKFWLDYGRTDPIKGMHTEVVIEPKAFMGGKLNPELSDLMLSVILSKTTKEDLKSGRVTIEREKLLIKDKKGRPIAEIRNRRMIREFASRFGR